MVQILLSDERGIISEEILGLMQKAADESFRSEFKDAFESEGLNIDNAEAELSLTAVDEAEIRELNREYRGNDSVTDVLSFPQFDTKESLISELVMQDRGVCMIGDVVLCIDQAKRQAEEYGTGIKREMLYLFVHSIMHLFGYDHMDEEEKRVMRSREEEVLQTIGIKR